VRIYQSILTYLLIFFALTILLRFLGIINIASSEVIGYGLIFFGGASVYISLGRNQKITLFLGTTIFLVGILLYVINNFLIFWDSYLLIPSLLIIPSLGFFVLFVEDYRNKRLLLISLLLFLFGLSTVVLYGQFNLNLFLSSIISVASNYWRVIFILAIIFIIVLWEERKT